ncbi:hypothetical protein [Cyclobacterium roseum]|uniref:hypothetical protein n=1 Tax=Cyclobacterium roseum TaxID=2666137 RepID=UPI0013909EFF|nr:hypothetical protein [Cyclobacterium roseum]
MVTEKIKVPNSILRMTLVFWCFLTVLTISNGSQIYHYHPSKFLRTDFDDLIDQLDKVELKKIAQKIRATTRDYFNEAKKQGLPDGNLHILNLRRIDDILEAGIVDGSKEELASKIKEAVAMQDNVVGIAALRSMLEYISTTPIPISKGLPAFKYLLGSIKSVLNEMEGSILEELIEERLDEAFREAKDSLDNAAKRALENSE